MPQIVEHIDKIAREKKRDVLFVTFQNEDNTLNSLNYEEFKFRKELLIWLDEHNISFKKCGHIASENGWEAYRGQIYIDLPFDENNEQYNLLDKHLMNEDNTPKIKGVNFYYLTLEIAMKNAHHDEPGFWEKWAEEF